MTETNFAPHRTLLVPIAEGDPRLTLDDRALVDASRNRFPIVARTTSRGDGRGLSLGAGIALMLGGLTFWTMSGHRTSPRAQPAPMAAPRPMVFPTAPLPTRPKAAVPQGFLIPNPPLITTPTAVHDPARSPTVVFDASSAPAASATDTTTAKAESSSTSAKPQGMPAGLGDNEQFASRVGSSANEVASAEQLSDPATTVVQGTLIPAVLETAIDTDLPGYVRAVVSQDVRSFDGSRILVPRSSRLVGQYKSGLTAGQTRAYVIWTRLIRPDGASVALASPSVDFAGNSGLAGKVDGHFMKRFGSAVLLSVVGGLSAVGSSSVVLSGGQSAASVAAQRDTQIPPTIKVLPGEPIRIFTAKDLDFSAVATDGAAQ